MSKKKPIKKMTLRGCQTALGIARRKMRDAEARHEIRYQLALENIRLLRQALGEPYAELGMRDYKQFNVDIALDRREFRPLPPIHIHITPKHKLFDSHNNAVPYTFEMYIPQGEILDYRTATKVHNALHQLVDFAEIRPNAEMRPNIEAIVK